MTTQNEYRLVQDLKDSLAHYFKEDVAPDVDQYGLLGEICGNHYFGLMQALKAAPQPAPSNEAALEALEALENKIYDQASKEEWAEFLTTGEIINCCIDHFEETIRAALTNGGGE